MAEIRNYSTNPDPQTSDRWPEGMAMSAVNDTGRVDEGIIARWYRDTRGDLVSTGSANAYSVTPNRDFSDVSGGYDGLELTFQANFTNTGPATLAAGAIAATAIKNNSNGGNDLIAGDISAGSKVTVRHNGTNWVLTEAASMPEVLALDRFGAKGDGSTDDTAAIQAAIDAAKTNGRGAFSGAVIYAPAGDYLITDELQVLNTNSEVENIHFVGDGGETGNGATRFFFAPTSAKNGILLKSALWCSFWGIEFVANTNFVKSCVAIEAFDNPAFSSYFVSFQYCSFRAGGGITPTDELVFIKNSAHTTFRHCWWSGLQQSVRLGENAGVDPGTFGNGTAGSTSFEHCYFSGDIIIRNAINTAFRDCEFARKDNPNLQPTQILLEGDSSCNNISFFNCQNVSENVPQTGTFFTQGAGNSGLVVEGCRFDPYPLTFDITGNGGARIQNNEFRNRSIAGTIGIRIGVNAENVEVHPNNFSNLESAGYESVDDNRTLPFKPFIVYQNLDTDYTFTANANFEILLSQSSVRFPGGFVRCTYAATVQNNSTSNALEWRFRIKVNGAIIRPGSNIYQQIDGSSNGQDKQKTILHQFIFRQDAIPAGGSVELEAFQGGSTTLSTIKATDTSFSTFLMMEILPG